MFGKNTSLIRQEQTLKNIIRSLTKGTKKIFNFCASLIKWLFFFAVVALLFYLLNQFYEAIWVKIIVALSVSRAIAKKQGKISLLNSYLGGFDLDSVPLIGQFAEGLTESYENWHQRKFQQLDDRCNKILSRLCVEKLRQECQGAIKRQQQSEYLFRNQAIQMVENQVEQRINHLPNETRRSRYLEQLQQIKNLPEQDRRIYLIALVEELCPRANASKNSTAMGTL